MGAIILAIPNAPDGLPRWLVIAGLAYVFFGGVLWRFVKRAASRERDER